jgi:hypothetical protein
LEALNAARFRPRFIYLVYLRLVVAELPRFMGRQFELRAGSSLLRISSPHSMTDGARLAEENEPQEVDGEGHCRRLRVLDVLDWTGKGGRGSRECHGLQSRVETDAATGPCGRCGKRRRAASAARFPEQSARCRFERNVRASRTPGASIKTQAAEAKMKPASKGKGRKRDSEMRRDGGGAVPLQIGGSGPIGAPSDAWALLAQRVGADVEIR